MANSALILIADAVAARLEAAKPDIGGLAAYTIAVTFTPNQELADLVDGHVDVIPKARASSVRSRAAKQRTHNIDLLIRRRATIAGEGQTTETVADAFLCLVEEIGDLFEGQRLDDHPAAMCTGWTNRPAWDPVHLHEYSQLTSLLTLEFTSSA